MNRLAWLWLIPVLVFGQATNEISLPSEPVPNPKLTPILDEVAVAYRSQKYDDAFKKIDEAAAVDPTDYRLFIWRGVIYTGLRQWDKAITAFEDLNHRYPKMFAARFNLGEVHFLEGKYDVGRSYFEGLLQEDSKNELVLYKIFLCHLQANHTTEAKAILDKLEFTSSTPIYYYANAAWSFKKGDMKAGNDWVQSGRGIYSEHDNEVFADSLIELGWLPRAQLPAASPASSPKE